MLSWMIFLNFVNHFANRRLLKSIIGEKLAKKLKIKDSISKENGEDQLNLIKKIRSKEKLSDFKWD